MRFYEITDKKIEIFDQRFYEVEGEYYENVTNILQIVDKGYYFQEWLMTNGLNSIYLRDRAGYIGSVAHHLIERFLKKEKILYDDIRYNEPLKLIIWERFLRWLKFYEKVKEHIQYRIEDIEKIVYSKEHKFGGMLDAYITYYGLKTIVDWKFGNSIQPTHDYQINAYALAMQEMGYEVEQGLIIHIPEKSNRQGYTVHKVEISEYKQDLFLKMQAVKNELNPAKPKFKEYPIEVEINDFEI